MNDKQLRQAIDACRPGSQDLAQAEFAELAERLTASAELRATYERAQSADRVLAQAMEDVPVPANLADRLLARLQASAPAAPSLNGTVSTAVYAAADAHVDQNQAVAPAAVARPTRSRRWRVALAAVAASVLAVLGWTFSQPQSISSDNMPELAAGIYDQLDGNWQGLQTAPASLAAPKMLIRPRDWQDVSRPFGHKAVAYRFALGGGSQAVLFAVNVKLDRVPSMPPARPQPTTGACSIAIWQSGGVAYVLVVKGDGRDYQRLFKSQPGTTA